MKPFETSETYSGRLYAGNKGDKNKGDPKIIGLIRYKKILSII